MFPIPCLARLALLWLCLSAATLGDEPPQSPKPKVSPEHVERAKLGTKLFREQVRGLLTTHCLDCHGGKSLKADFDLSTRAALMESGYVGETAGESYLIELLTHASEPHMPKNAARLPEDAINLIRQWVDLGAPYDRALSERAPTQAPGALQVSAEDRDYWAFQPLRSIPIPNVQNPDWCRTPIDYFILSRLEAAGLSPNPVASARTLVRRSTCDLLGLPATADTIDAYTTSAAPDRWSRHLDGLLSSPHFGERWARHWMDVARFAESHGYEQDYDRPHAYPYRDFLIQAFNADLPFDQFVQWQLAGDELAPDNPLALMATGFLGAGPFPTQLTEAEFESARYDELDDMVTTTGVAFLGLSVGCARCHDHKFDPIPSLDYYRLAANFTSTIRSEIELDLQPERNQERQLAYEARLATAEHQLREFEQQQLPEQLTHWLQDDHATAVQPSWETLKILDIESSGGTRFEAQADGSWLAVGQAPATDTWTITAESYRSTTSKLRLEALTHASLPHQGPGRAGNGNFALGHLHLAVAAADVGQATTAAVENWRAVTLRSAAATHQQNETTLGVAASIDADPISGWAVDGGGIGHDQAAVFEFESPVTHAKPTRWTIRLEFNHPNTQHSLGRVRLSVSDSPQAAVAVGSDELSPELLQALEQAQRVGPADAASWRTVLDWFAQTLPEWQALNQRLQQIRQQGPQLELTQVMVTSEGLPPMSHHADGRGFPHHYPVTYVLARGDVQQKGEAAQPGVLQVLTADGAEERVWQPRNTPQPAQSSYRRAALARWMTDVDQGAGALVARVIVNRLWQHHFGRGLVPTPNDFGSSGELPSHPDLLEWLANDLVAHNWELKRLHRLMMTSSVYLQSSDHDASRASLDRENTLLWRWSPRRLEAEAIRDSLLAVSGQLDPRPFGPGTLDPNMQRRSIYFFIKRSQLIPSLMLFDWPEHLVSIGRRSSTTIAPQALMFMNSQQTRHYAAAVAKQLPQAPLEEQIAAGFRTILARPPTNRERQAAVEFLQSQSDLYRQQQVAEAEAAAWTDFCQTLFSMNEFIYID